MHRRNHIGPRPLLGIVSLANDRIGGPLFSPSNTESLKL
jgi:hypothetical protein